MEHIQNGIDMTFYEQLTSLNEITYIYSQIRIKHKTKEMSIKIY